MTTTSVRPGSGGSQIMKRMFVRLGVLPFLLLIALVVFGSMSGNFFTPHNLTNVVRQSVFLAIVAMGQMIALLTGGFDLSVGTILAVTSVIGTMAMAAAVTAMPNAAPAAIAIGWVAGIGAGTLIGAINGIGVAAFGVSPFIMTLGVSSIGFGIALYLTAGMPVSGLPTEFGDFFGFGTFLGIPVPVWAAILLMVCTFILVNWTRFGRGLYAVGGNARAALLSGIDTRRTQFFVYVTSGLLASIAGMLLTARLGTGEANIGSAMPLESIAACVIAGVSLRGGVGRVENVILGALFINLVQNGMNIVRIQSYLQTVVIGVILIAAVIADQIRLRYIADPRS